MLVNFGKMMRTVASTYGDKTALVNVERDRRFTYRELNSLTNRICNAMMLKSGVTERDAAAVLLENDNASLCTFWLCKAPSALLLMDFADSRENHLSQIDAVHPRVLFLAYASLEEYREDMLRRGVQIVCFDAICDNLGEGVVSIERYIDGVSDEDPDVEYDFDGHVAVLRPTGGTSGKSKLVAYSLRNWFECMYLLFAQDEPYYDQGMRFLHATPITHGTIGSVLPVFFKGGTQYTVNHASARLIARTITEHRITTTFAVPTVLYRVEEAVTKVGSGFDLTSLQTVFYGGAPIDPQKLKRLTRVFGPVFVQFYGSSEALPPLCCLSKRDHVRACEDRPELAESAGRVNALVELQIRDGDGGKVPDGQPGEIYVRCGTVVRGYLDDEEMTHAEFTSDGFWKSGDVGRIASDGYLYVLGRTKNMIISGGFNVYAAEVENAICLHPSVSQCVVIGRPHPDWGEAVHAEVVLRADAPKVTEQEIIEHCKRYLGKYKVPKTVCFVDSLPESTVGKVLRRKVQEKYARG